MEINIGFPGDESKIIQPAHIRNLFGEFHDHIPFFLRHRLNR